MAAKFGDLLRVHVLKWFFFKNVPNINLYIVKQRLKDQFIQNLNGRLEESSRAIVYKHISSFGFKPYLNILNISKFRYSITNLRVSSHRLSIESGRWSKPNPTPLSESNC